MQIPSQNQTTLRTHLHDPDATPSCLKPVGDRRHPGQATAKFQINIVNEEIADHLCRLLLPQQKTHLACTLCFSNFASPESLFFPAVNTEVTCARRRLLRRDGDEPVRLCPAGSLLRTRVGRALGGEEEDSAPAALASSCAPPLLWHMNQQRETREPRHTLSHGLPEEVPLSCCTSSKNSFSMKLLVMTTDTRGGNFRHDKRKSSRDGCAMYSSTSAGTTLDATGAMYSSQWGR